jgi:A24 family peptidase
LLLNIGLLIFNFHFFDIFEWSLLVVIYHILYFIARGSLGYGDIKVFCVLVLNLNFFEGIYLFAFTFLYAGFFALGILVFKKVKRGTKIPLVPFIALGYFSVLLIREGILW